MSYVGFCRMGLSVYRGIVIVSCCMQMGVMG